MDRPKIPATGLKLLYYAQELRGKICRPMQIDDRNYVEELVQHMVAFTIAHNGVGLAAPQVGHFIRIAVVLPPEENRAHILINPEITSFRGCDVTDHEACLSIPPSRNTARVVRSETITIACGTLENPLKKQLSHHHGYEARIMQHEVDHLDGLFFIDRVSHLQRNLVLKKYEKWQQRRKSSR